jgi:hypothetical protein
VAGFTAAYTVAAPVAAWTSGNGEFLLYVAVMAVLVAATWVLHRRVRLTLGALWAMSIWGALHMAGGLVPVPEGWPIAGENRVLYSLWLIPGWLKYDHVTHFYGFGVLTWVLWQGLRSAVQDGEAPRPTPGLLVLCAAASMGFGALNEVVEFAATRLLPETNVGGYDNTGWDLVANAAGAITAAVVIGLTAFTGEKDNQYPQGQKKRKRTTRASDRPAKQVQ